MKPSRDCELMKSGHTVERRCGVTDRMLLALASCLLALILWGPPAMAADLGEWVPGLRITPFLSEKVEYQSNVFEVPSHSQGDVIFKTIPGILGEYSVGSHALSVGYRAEILNYDRLSNQNTVNHYLAGQVHLDFARTVINIKDEFVRTTDPPGTELTGPLASRTNTVRPDVEYRLTSRFSLGTNFSWLSQRYDDASVGNLIDRDEYMVGGSLFWKILPKSDVSLNYYHAWANFTEATDRDYESNAFTLAIRGEMTAKLSSTFRIGYLQQDTDTSGQVGYSGWITGGDWIFKPTDRTIISLATLHVPQVSTDGLNPYYTTTSAILSGSHELMPKLSVGGRIGGGINEYPMKDTIGGQTKWRDDTFVLAGAQIDYNIQPWLRVGLEYIRTARYSNFSLFNFVDDRVSGRVTVQY